MGSSPDLKPQHRPIRSFVRREGRMTAAQRRALDELLPQYGVSDARPLDNAALFGRAGPLHLEIGFGNGDALLRMALDHPANNYLGAEVHRPGVGHLLQQLEKNGIQNVRVSPHDATEVLARLGNASLAAIYIFFPDPWPKKRHHKRRLIQTAFAWT